MLNQMLPIVAIAVAVVVVLALIFSMWKKVP